MYPLAGQRRRACRYRSEHIGQSHNINKRQAPPGTHSKRFYGSSCMKLLLVVFGILWRGWQVFWWSVGENSKRCITVPGPKIKSHYKFATVYLSMECLEFSDPFQPTHCYWESELTPGFRFWKCHLNMHSNPIWSVMHWRNIWFTQLNSRFSSIFSCFRCIQLHRRGCSDDDINVEGSSVICKTFVK